MAGGLRAVSTHREPGPDLQLQRRLEKAAVRQAHLFAYRMKVFDKQAFEDGVELREEG